ncbi:dynein regulatory complex subunit 2 isoform X2 [Brachyistius frenatus]|uniref:dynein regulatory complex subunit 2 isoform X2 n=1 Tax=Brachyistius frenatus TaxID=100188 RepID=UPI0037E8241F
MPKKAKKGVRKTEAERLVQLQQRTQAEEEMAKKKEETLTLFLKDKLQKEQRDTVGNLLKLSDGWRTTLRQTRDGELRKDSGVLHQTFVRRLDDLDSVVEMVRELQEVELQAAQVQAGHLQQVEGRRAQQDKRIWSWQQQWDKNLQDLDSKFSCDKVKMKVQSEQLNVKLQDLSSSAENQNKEQMADIQRQFEENLESHVTANQSKVTIKKDHHDPLGQKAEALKNKAMDSEVINVVLRTNKEKIDAQVKRSEELQENIKLISCQRQTVEEELTAATNEVNQKILTLQTQFTRCRTDARKRLTELSVQGHSATNRLQAVYTKGENVLRAADMYCKLESKHDISSSSSSSSLSSSHHTEEQDRNTAAQEVGGFPEMQQLMRRLSAPLLLREALQKRKETLSQENKQLELLLRRDDDALDGHRAPLPVLRVPTTTVRLATGRANNVIEAVHVVQHSL